MLAAAYLEVDAGAAGPVVRFQHFGVALHFAPGLDAEMAQHVEGDVHVRDALGLADAQQGLLVAQRQGHQQARDELRTAFAGDLRRARDEVPLDAGGDEDFLAFALLRVGEQHAEGGHDVRGAAEGSAEQGAVAVHGEIAVAHGGEHRNGQAREQAGFAGVHAVRMQLSAAGADAGNGQVFAVLLDLGAEGAGEREGGFRVPAGAVSAQVRAAFRQGRGEDRPLGEALRRGHPAAFHPVGLAVAVEGGVQLRERPLAGGGSIIRAQRGKGERRAAAQAL